MLSFLLRLRARLRNRQFDDDLREELRLHEEMKREELEAGGVPPADARAEARRALGNVTRMREEARGVWIAPWLESIGQDVRYAVRTLTRQPLHTLTALSVLVLAITMITSLFTVFKATSLAPWPARDPDRVVRIVATSGPQWIGPSVDEYRFVREHASTLRGVAAYSATGGVRLRAPGRVETYPQSGFATANLPDVLGARMHLGTGFIPDDDLPGDRRGVAILSHFLWRSYFGADPAVVGQIISVDGASLTVVGVLEPRMDGLSHPVDIWLPFSTFASLGPVTAAGVDAAKSGNCCIDMMARLADGVDRARAQQEVQMLHERFTTAGRRKTGVVEVHGTSYVDGPGRRSDLDVLYALFAALGLVLILACANVGNLQLARGLARRREIATRMAIGAGRGRIVRQLLVEGLVLAGAAGATSVAVAAFLPAAVLGLMGQAIPPTRAERFVPDWQVIALTASICVVSVILFALAPALHATRRTIPLGTLDRSSTRRARFHLRGGLLAVQIAACTVLLIGAGLVSRAIVHAMAFDPGFRVQGVMRVSAFLPSGTSADQRRLFADTLLAQLEQGAAEPIAVASHGVVTPARFFTMNVVLPQENATDYRSVERRGVSRQYFDALGIPLVKGRTFASDAVGEVIVNETFARVYWRGADPLGQTIREVDRSGAIVRAHTIVGVVRDAYLAGLERVEPMIFRPARQGTFVTAGGPEAIARIRAAAAGLNAAATVRVWPLTDDLRKHLEESRMGAAVAWAIGLLGLLLAAVGVLGVFSYAVEERRREIGVRLALGAARRQIVGMLVTSSGRAMALGLGAGILLSFACGPVLRAYLYGLSPLDPMAYGGVLLLLAATGTLATLVPARRACRVDPAITLRED